MPCWNEPTVFTVELMCKWSWLLNSVYWWCEEWVALYLYSLHMLSWHVWGQLYSEQFITKKRSTWILHKIGKKLNLPSIQIKLSIQRRCVPFQIFCYARTAVELDSTMSIPIMVLSDWNIIFRQSMSKWLREKRNENSKKWAGRIGTYGMVPANTVSASTSCTCKSILSFVEEYIYKSLKKVCLTRGCVAKINYLIQNVYRIIF